MNHHRPTGRGARAAIVGAALALLIGVAPATAATGNYGVYALVDSLEYPAVACTYVGHPAVLGAFRIRPPIVYGVNRSDTTDTQTVGWMFKVQYQDGTATTWTTLFTSTEAKAPTTEKRNAAFAPRTYAFGPNVTDHERYRVLYDLRWYFPTSTHQDGRVTTHPSYYKEKFSDVPSAVTMDYCFGLD
jgi:hypothetical protein